MSRFFQNHAGNSDAVGLDAALRAELEYAGIVVEMLPESLRAHYGVEIKSTVLGTLHGWSFKRAWRYWVCSEPGIPHQAATDLHCRFGNEVRVSGHCGCPSPMEHYSGLGVGRYHVDTWDGLKALAETISTVVDEASGGPIRLGKFPFTEEAEWV